MKKWIKQSILTVTLLTWLTETAAVIITTPTFGGHIHYYTIYVSSAASKHLLYPCRSRGGQKCYTVFLLKAKRISLLDLIQQIGVHLTLINTAFSILGQRSFKTIKRLSHFEILLFLFLAAQPKWGNNLKLNRNIKTRKFSCHSLETH